MALVLSVIVPIFNEEESAELLYRSVVAALEPMNCDFELIIVDDGSTDSSFTRLSTLAAADPRLVLIRFRRNEGQTAAMAAGISRARGRVLATMDGDLQNDPRDIPMMVAKLRGGYDLVVGWRMNRQDKWLSRRLPSAIANWLIGKITGFPIRDNGCSLKVYRADVIQAVPLYSDMHRFIPAMSLPYGARIAEVGVRHHARQYGASKYGLSRIFKVLLDLITIKTLLVFARCPIKSFGTVAMIPAALAAVFGWQALAGLGVDGDGSIMVFSATAVLFGVLAAFLLLLGTIVAVIFMHWGGAAPGNPVPWVGHE